MTVSAAISAPVSGVDAANVAGTVAGAAGGHDSLVGLFLNADPLVMFIMLLLVVMSIASWAIIFEKWMTFHQLAGRSENFENEFWTAEALDKFYDRIKKRKSRHPMALMFTTAMDEWFRSKNNERLVGRPAGSGELTITLKERMLQQMVVVRNRELERLEQGLGFLATAGSSAPFIGLLGTVIGIMNSFRAIAGTQNTSLAVVAPGIAEALFVTAIGLFVAIPAVMAFNKFNGELNRIAGKLEDFSTEFHTLLSRQLDKGAY
ncbi:MAG: protein TolQ [Rickettsiales bacterium]|jgi:biopolymer transport protein TolQ|nr:protein TolQ [Rickettsiales bacterium]